MSKWLQNCCILDSSERSHRSLLVH